MDAIKFIKEMGRMCDSNRRDNCDECPFTVNKDTCFMGSMWHNPEEAVEIVEQWGKENPQKTYKDDFLEKFPKAELYSSGAPKCCKKQVYGLEECENDNCSDCWNMEMEDDQ